MFDYMEREEFTLERYEGKVDRMGGELYSPPTTIRGMSEARNIFIQSVDKQELKREKIYMIRDKTIKERDKIDGLKVTSVEHITDINGVYHHSEITVR